MINRWFATHRDRPLSFLKSVAHADALASLIDEIETAAVDLSALEGLVEESLAVHWAEVRDFLLLVRDIWPSIQQSEKTQSPSAYLNHALSALAQRLARSEQPVIAAGSTGSNPATADLLATIASLPNGAVVLPGLDLALEDAGWERVSDDPAHSQHGLKQLIERLGVKRRSVPAWTASTHVADAREIVIAEILRPAPTTDAWRRLADDTDARSKIAEGLKGIAFVEASNQAEEASAIALILRETLERPRDTAALITPDRKLARRVAAELAKFAVDVDDSAGSPLAHSPPGTLLLLIVEAAAARFAPVALLALLKHPLVSLGIERGVFLRHVRSFDLMLRGRGFEPGLAGIERTIPSDDPLFTWFKRVSDALRPLEQLYDSGAASISALLDAHILAAEKLSQSGTEVLVWERSGGARASELCASLHEAVVDLPDIETSAYAGFFRLVAQETAVRPNYGRHPRLKILGPLEARLQSFDLVILGSLNEGSWPRPASAGPWLSRPMRVTLGLQSPERSIGLSAHDFASLLANPKVVLTRSTKYDGAQVVASRWVQRLQQLARGLELPKAMESATDWVGIARSLAEVGRPQRTSRPTPCPPITLRPRRLSVTEVEVWRRDPYAIYARHILGLLPLKSLVFASGPLERGSAVHKALEEFVALFPQELPDDAVARLVDIGEHHFQTSHIPDWLLSIWRPRLKHAAEWFVTIERERRQRIVRSHTEVAGTLTLEGVVGPFVLHGRADRIDVLNDGTAAILDYKTGMLPTHDQIKAHLAPQLSLEAAMAFDGGFEGLDRLVVSELAHVQFAGGSAPGVWRATREDAAILASNSRDALRRRILRFDHVETPYVSRALAFRSDFLGVYDHLARVGEWSRDELEGWDP